jgi:hypothetical protein
MIGGKMVPLGLCQNGIDSKKMKIPVVTDNNSTEEFKGTCTLKKDSYISKLPP